MAAEEQREPAPSGETNGTGSNNTDNGIVRSEADRVQGLEPDLDAMVQYLQLHRPGGPWVLTALPKETTRTFAAGDEPAMREWVRIQNVDLGQNAHLHINTAMRPLAKKASKTDMASVDWLHVDIDPRPGKDIDEERKRILAMLGAHEGLPPPTVIVSSGGGYWGLWRLKNPLPIDGDLVKAKDAERYNIQVARLMGADKGADACHNCDRIMRLPGTINWPNDKKKAKGQVPALAYVVEQHDDRVYPLSMFAQAEVVQSGGSAPLAFDASKVGGDVTLPETLHPAARRLVEDGCEVAVLRDIVKRDLLGAGHKIHEWIAKGSRNEAQYWATLEMLRRGMAPEQVLTVLLDDRNGISRAVKKTNDGKSRPRRYAERQVRRAAAEVQAAGQPAKDAPGSGAAQGDDEDLILEKWFRARLVQLGIRLEYDEFQDRIRIEGLDGYGPYLNDAALIRLRIILAPKAKRLPPKETVQDLCINEANHHRRHPVREYLDAKQKAWDGIKRVDTWMVDYLGAPDTAYVRAVSRIFLVAAVRRVRHPGCKFDELVVLEGDQGSGKSTVLKRLAVNEDWFTDDLPLNADGKRMIEQTRGKWIIECGELKGMRKNDVESLKATLSRTHDRARLAWGRIAGDVPRQWVGAGTTNSRKYLRDQTGNRRFWGVPTGDINLAGFTREVVDQLWGEAAALEAEGDPQAIRLDPALYDAAAEMQRERTAEDPVNEVLVQALDEMKNVRIPTEDVWCIVGCTNPKDRDQELNVRLGEVMQRLGFVRERRRLNGDLVYFYVHEKGKRLVQAMRGPRGEFLGWKPEGPSDVPPGPF